MVGVWEVVSTKTQCEFGVLEWTQGFADGKVMAEVIGHGAFRQQRLLSIANRHSPDTPTSIHKH